MRWPLVILSLSVGVGLGSAAHAYTLFGAETEPFSLGNDTSRYGGVQRYDIATPGGAAVAGPGIAASSLSDPAGLAFSGNSLYVGNRHGNTLGLGSVQKFDWDGSGLSGSGTIATASSSLYAGFHGITFAPNGDLFASTVSGGTRRFRDSGSGFVDIGGTSPKASRDAWVTPDGKYLYESDTVNNTLVVTEVLPDGFGTSTSFGVAGMSAPHQMAFLGGNLYVTGYTSGTVHRVALTANYLPGTNSIVAQVTGALGIAFAPDGGEAFISRHGSTGIARFLVSGTDWTSNGLIDTGKSMGYLEVVPEPGTLLALGVGVAALARRRRSR